MMKSLQYFSISVCYALTWLDLFNITLSSRIRNFKTHINGRTRMSRWLGSDDKLRRMWLGREIVVSDPPPLCSL